MKKWWIVCAFLVGYLTGYLALYASVRDRIVTVPCVDLGGEVAGWLQMPRDGSVVGVQLYNGTSNAAVITRVCDAQGHEAEFTQLHVARLVGGRGYLAAGKQCP